MNDVQQTVNSPGFQNLHPAVQCTIVIVIGFIIIAVILAWFTDFWNKK